ncbi:MAG: SUMF1/EgtB/PvdO family nonheme iron enzyme [Cyanomargarita calcarea GSE-NOS-MK-12-04C]|uniref:SUMF1/EgtB/PvdO family nonheme iron enzyme n=1 Tax=Cyanomargarita calcarea GSE-NOS-MK-12-04C TaxID=2839659 RepID=A0A951QP84_9CYAN|nr:SUMF1/EgtB/PvdO family nonheme iron enzyme [Cyanomargarita calcarea GSE-NOS-MK-12-04C]
MHGNVWEWCQDTWHDSYKGAPSNGSAWIGNDNQTRLVRGGSWDNIPEYCRSAYRFLITPDTSSSILVFGLCALRRGLFSP